MATNDLPLLRYDMAGTVGDGLPLHITDFDAIFPQLEACRVEFLTEDLELYHGDPAAIPPEKEPLDAGFFELPEKILADYAENRDASELGRILNTAKRLKASVDRVVVLGIGGSYMGARALFEACCHPYHNELSRAERGGVPRIYFEGNNVDNDAVRGLIELVGGEQVA